MTRCRKILILGNAGAGKSTLAKKLAHLSDLIHLDLDSLAWHVELPGARRPLQDSTRDIDTFISQQNSWVIEGCHASLLEYVAPYCTEMVFLNPGIEICQRHNRLRPWEPHKYPSAQAQHDNLAMLQSWVAAYCERDDEYSYLAHRRLFDNFKGTKKEIHDEIEAEQL